MGHILSGSLIWPYKALMLSYSSESIGDSDIGDCRAWGWGGECLLVVMRSKLSLLKWPFFHNFKVTCWRDRCKSMAVKHQGKQCEREASVLSKSESQASEEEIH